VTTSIVLALLLIWMLLSAAFLVAVCMISSRMSRAQEVWENGTIRQAIVTHKPPVWEHVAEPGEAFFAK
jgi:hypothetical protein